MSNKKKVQNVMVIVLGVAIIGLSALYAAFDTSFENTKTYAYPEAKWDVHLENPLKTSNTSVSIEEMKTLTLNESATELTFNINLSAGETYEFTVNVVNSGNIDAKLDHYNLVATQNGNNVNVSELGEASINYQVSNLEVNESLPRGYSNTKKVTIICNDGIDVNYDFTFSTYYVQDKK